MSNGICDVPGCTEETLISWTMSDGPSQTYKVCRQCLSRYFRNDATLTTLKLLLRMKTEMKEECRNVVVNRAKTAAQRAISSKLDKMDPAERKIYLETWEESLWDA